MKLGTRVPVEMMKKVKADEFVFIFPLSDLLVHFSNFADIFLPTGAFKNDDLE